MLFSRRKSATKQSERRQQYRGALPTAILASLETSIGVPITGELGDLTVQGAGVRIPFEHDPNLAPEDVIELTIHSVEDQWAIRTPARVCQVRQDGMRHILYGFEFINLGNLYSQLENALGRYFNRRRELRVRPQLDQQLSARLFQRHHRIAAQVYDVSRHGVGVVVSTVQAAEIEIGGEVRVRLDFPNHRRAVEVKGIARHRNRLAAEEILGIEFVDASGAAAACDNETLVEYVTQREAEMARWEEIWTE